MDETKTVTSQFERVCQPADTVLTNVEGILAVVRPARVSVGHDHLGEPHAAKQGAAIISNMVEDQPLARREADEELPLLPVHTVAILYRKASALGLRDLEGFEVGAQRPHVLWQVIGLRLRNGDGAKIINANDLHRVQVEDRSEERRVGKECRSRWSPYH